MAISRVRFQASGNVNATTSLALPLGGTATAGNVLVAVWAIDKDVTSITAPSGWTTLASQLGTSVSFLVCGKVAAGTETTATASFSGGSAAPSGASGVIAEYSGVDTANPWGPSNLPTYSDTAVTSKTLDPAAATAAGAALAFFAMDSVDSAAAGSTGFQPAATGFTWVTTAFDNLSGTANSGTPGAAFVENLSITSGQDIAPAFTWTRLDQVAGFIQLLNAATSTSVTKIASVTGSTAGAGTSFTVPAGVTPSHLGVVLFASANPYTSGFTITMPAGWFKQADHPSQASNSEVYVFTRLGGYTAGDTVAWTQNSATGWAYYAVWFDTSGRNVAITGAVGGRSGTSSADVVIPGITTTVANQDVLVVATERTTATGTVISSWTGGTPTTDVFAEESGTSNTTGFIGHFTQATAGSTGNRTVTYNSASGNGAGLMLALGTPVGSAAIAGIPTTGEVASGTTVTCNVPSGVTAGELLVAAIAHSSSATVPTPSGWTAAGSSPMTNINVAMFYRIAASEPASYTFTGLASGRITAHMVRVSGASTTQPDVAAVTGTTTGTAAIALASQTTTLAGALLIGGLTTDSAATDNVTPPSEQTPLVSSTGTGRRLNIAVESRPTAGAVGTRSWSQGTAALNTSAMQIAIRPATAASGPTIRSSSISTATQANPTLSIPKPTGVVAGDTLYLLAASDDSSPTSVPTGWTQIYSADSAGGFGPIHAQVYRRVADGSEGSTFSITYGANCDAQASAIAVVGGSATGEVFSTFSDQTTTAGTSMTANSVTPAAANSLLIGAFVSRNLSGVFTTATPPSGMTELQDGNQDWISLEVCAQTGVPASATGSKVATASASSYSGNWLMAIAPSASVTLPFTETFTGTNGAGWGANWDSTAFTAVTPDIQSNAGRMRSGAATYTFSRAYLTAMPSTTDTDVVLSFTFSSQIESYLYVGVNADNTGLSGDTFFPSNGYGVEIACATTAASGFTAIFKHRSGGGATETDTSAETSNLTKTITAGTQYKIRVQRVGPTVRHRIWAAAGSEPTTWDQTYTDSGTLLTGGRLLLTTSNGSPATQSTVTVDDLTVSAATTPYLRSTATAGNGQTSGVSSLSLTIPSGVQDNDVAIIEAVNSTATQTLTTPTGWTLSSGNNSTTGVATWIFTKTLSATDAGTSVSLAFGASARAGAVMSVWGNATLTNAQTTFATDASATTTPAIPSLASVNANSLLITSFARRSATTTADDVGLVSGNTDGVRMATAYTTQPQYSVEHQYQVVTSAGSVGGGTGTSSVSANGVNYLISLRSATDSATTWDGAGTASAATNATADGTTGAGAPLLSTLVEPFAAQDNVKWTYSASATVSGGRLILAPNAGYNGIISTGSYNLAESSVFFELPTGPDPTNTGNEFWFQLNSSSGSNFNDVGFDLVGGQLKAFYDVAGSRTVASQVAYNATNHRWMRIRETGGTVFWDTSVDGVSWTNLTSWLRTFGVGSLFVLTGTGYIGTPVPTQNAILDNVNYLPSIWAGAGTASAATNAVGAGSNIPTWEGSGTASANTNAAGAGQNFPLASTLVDNFTTQDTTKWNWGTLASVVNGRLSTVRDSAYNGMITGTGSYQMTGSSIAIELVSCPTSSPYTDTSVGMYGPGNLNAVTMDIETQGPLGGTQSICAYIKTGGSWSGALGAVAYNATNHRWLRIREASGAIVFEASPDRTAWSTIYTTTTPSFVGSEFMVPSIFSGEGSGETVLWDNFNYAPVVSQGAGTASGNTNATGAGTFVRPVSTLVENWATGFDTLKWARVNSTRVQVIGGRLQIDTGTAAGDYAWASSVDRFTLANSAMSSQVDWDPVTFTGSTEMLIQVAGQGSGNYVEWAVGPSGAAARAWTAGVPDVTAIGAPTRGQLYRISNVGGGRSGGTISFETSMDGVVWAQQATKTVSWDISDVMVWLVAGHWDNSVGSVNVYFDNVNVAPSVLQGSGTVTGNGSSTGAGTVWKYGAGEASVGTDAQGDGTFFNPEDIVIYSTLTGTFTDDWGQSAQGTVVFTPETRYRRDTVNSRFVVMEQRVVELDANGSFSTSLPGNAGAGRVYWRWKCELIRTDDPHRQVFFFIIPVGTVTIDLADAIEGGTGVFGSPPEAPTAALFPSDGLFPSDDLFPIDL
jgi:hypothetical protein